MGKITLVKTIEKLGFLTYKLEFNEFNSLPENVSTHKNAKAIHFIGLGGIGMSGIAKIMAQLNYKISGSDIKDNPTLFGMTEKGATVYIGHHENNIQDSGLIVVSSAIDSENPEILAARKNNIPIIHRSQMLALILSGKVFQKTDKVSIGVTGTHGKTTTSGMIGVMFEHANRRPTVIVGGQLPHLNTNSKLGSGNEVIAELDESDGTITLYNPSISIITNLELDHSDHYEGGMDQLINTFKKFISNLDNKSKLIINIDSEGNRTLLKEIEGNNKIQVITYTTEENTKADYQMINSISEGFRNHFEVTAYTKNIGKFEINLPGMHNVSNAIACIAAGNESGLKYNEIKNSISLFTGMKRRFHVIGNINNTRIIDDYAHHPTEVKATLKAAKEIIKTQGKGKVIAVFEPHRYSRLETFWNEFLNSFSDCDLLFVTDVYAAHEKAIPGINAETFVKEIGHKQSQYVKGSLEEIAEQTVNSISPNDLFITLGAGTITKLGNIILEKLNKKR